MTQPAAATPSLAHPIRRGFIIVLGIWSAILLGAAGSVGWGRGWLEIVLLNGGFLVNFLVLQRVNPAVLIGREQNTRPTTAIDRFFAPALFLLNVAVPLAAGLDARFHGPRIPRAWLGPGVLLHLLGNGFILWSMAVNPFLEQMIRIQTDRGHQVASGGPYRLVRHPMYLGCILLFLAMPLVLGTPWAFVPAAGVAGVMILRTAFEDAYLQRDLPGYADFARRTRRRLFPGIW